MPKTMPKNKITDKQRTWVYLIAGIVILAIGGWLWWQNIYSTPERVFWATMDNNLVTTGITKHNPPASAQDSATTADQYTRLSFGAQNLVRIQNTLVQSDGKTSSTVKTETIGTINNDYARYISIKTDQKTAEGKPLDFTKIQGVWGKTPDAQPGQPASATYFQQAVLGLVPFAYFNSELRSQVMNFMQQNQVYKVDFSKAQKKTVNGKSVYVYPVDIMPKAYASLLVDINKKLGLGSLSGLDPASYDSTPPIKTEFTVDKTARQLVSVKYIGNAQEEDYSGYGISTAFELPTQTIPISELQNRIQSIQ